MPRALSRQIMRCGYLLCNGQPVTVRQAVSEGDRLTVLLPAADSNVAPERGPLSVLYEDSDLLVVNKPPGQLIHPARAEARGTLANLVAGHLADAGAPATPRPVGRLDRGVSGLSIWARTRYAHAVLAAERASGQLTREYLAITGPGDSRRAAGVTSERVASPSFDPARYTVPRPARTLWRVLARWPGGNLVLVKPETGRTHQIRQHLASIGLPLYGDTLYGGDARTGIRRPALHAWRAGLHQPVDGRLLCVRAPLPPDMRRLAGLLAAAGGRGRSQPNDAPSGRHRVRRQLRPRRAERSERNGGWR
ncbi:MAG: RluA family pseudouridine synthase [Bacillota bacterium]|nr:RluA family pseudouridine synthase [Bacillota bacterium]